MRVLAVIPARGGSKGLPRKNILPVAGKPLIGWTIDEARMSRFIDRLVLSSDDAEIIGAARALGCEVPFVRPATLSGDDVPGSAPVTHALENLPGFDLVVLLQPTSPLRKAEDIDACIDLCASGNAPACVSVCEAAHHPHWTYSVDPAGRLQPYFAVRAARRQDLPKAYAVNGAVYAAGVAAFREARDFFLPGTVAHVMPADRSIDIDSEIDLELAECMILRKRGGR